MEPENVTPKYPRHPQIERLRGGRWKMEEIADEIGASVREVYRWAAGQRKPIGIYEKALSKLPTERSVAA